jgi:hypothetical protein
VMLLSPRHAFAARRMSQACRIGGHELRERQVAVDINERIVAQAVRAVYASTKSHLRLVEKRPAGGP